MHDLIGLIVLVAEKDRPTLIKMHRGEVGVREALRRMVCPVSDNTRWK